MEVRRPDPHGKHSQDCLTTLFNLTPESPSNFILVEGWKDSFLRPVPRMPSSLLPTKSTPRSFASSKLQAL